MIGKAHPALEHVGHAVFAALSQHLVQRRAAQVEIEAHHAHVALALEAEGEIGQRRGLAGGGVGRDDGDAPPAMDLGLVDDLGAQQVVGGGGAPALGGDHALALEMAVIDPRGRQRRPGRVGRPARGRGRAVLGAGGPPCGGARAALLPLGAGAGEGFLNAFHLKRSRS